MRHRTRLLKGAGLLLVTAAVLAAGPAGLLTRAAASGAGSPAGAAVAYLKVRAAAAVPGASVVRLSADLPAGSPLAHREATLARGSQRLAARLGHVAARVVCTPTVTGVTVSPDGLAASVRLHVITLTTWTDVRGRTDTEGSGVDHTVGLRLAGGAWRVVADDYLDDTAPRALEAGGAPAGLVGRGAAALERAARAAEAGAASQSCAPPAVAAPLGIIQTFYFDRAAAGKYADTYALSYNPTYVSFSADCANFGSQTMFAGGFPKAPGSYEQGWWYDKKGTSGPGDDTYSHSWIAVIPQQGYWNGRYTDVIGSISNVAKGDFCYYDWTGDGSWDHVAEFVGINASGQKIVDAHTTDHLHVFWKLGTSATKYRLAKTKASVNF